MLLGNCHEDPLETARSARRRIARSQWVCRNVVEFEHALIQPVHAQLVVIFIFIFIEFVELIVELLELVVVDLIELVGFNGRLPVREFGAAAGQPARNAGLDLRWPSVATNDAGPFIGEDTLGPARDEPGCRVG
jgi:hypothetical protein